MTPTPTTRLAVHLEQGDRDALHVADVAVDRGDVVVQLTDAYRHSGLDLAPVRLPAATTVGVQRHPSGDDFGPLPGLLDDAMPDAWGRAVLDRALRAAGVLDPTLLDRLAWLGHGAMGALSFHPATGPVATPEVLDLRDAHAQAVTVLRRRHDDTLDPAAIGLVLKAGGSPGGARPKLAVGIDDEGTVTTDAGDLAPGATAWLLKFAADGDLPDASRVEAAYLSMASAAGIDVPEHRLLVDDDGAAHLAVRRFDRVGHGPRPARRHLASVSGLLHASHLHPSVGYEDVIRLTRLLTRDQRQLTAMFRRMVFNVAAHNRDDHTKNTAFLMAPDGTWTLSPAYDLTYAPGPGGEHTMDVAGHGTAITREHVHALGPAAGLSRTEVDEVVDEVVAVVDAWPEHAESAGVSARSHDLVAGVLVRL